MITYFVKKIQLSIATDEKNKLIATDPYVELSKFSVENFKEEQFKKNQVNIL